METHLEPSDAGEKVKEWHIGSSIERNGCYVDPQLEMGEGHRVLDAEERGVFQREEEISALRSSLAEAEARKEKLREIIRWKLQLILGTSGKTEFCQDGTCWCCRAKQALSTHPGRALDKVRDVIRRLLSVDDEPTTQEINDAAESIGMKLEDK